jgi:hypothetical protein
VQQNTGMTGKASYSASDVMKEHVLHFHVLLRLALAERQRPKKRIKYLRTSTSGNSYWFVGRIVPHFSRVYFARNEST